MPTLSLVTNERSGEYICLWKAPRPAPPDEHQKELSLVPYAGNNCWTPLAACSQGVCIENGELLIAAVLLFIFLLNDRGPQFPPCR